LRAVDRQWMGVKRLEVGSNLETTSQKKKGQGR
jgi:hypothetical protein